MCAVPAPLVRYETLISSNLNESAMRNTLLHTVAASPAVITRGVSPATSRFSQAARHGCGGSHPTSGAAVQFPFAGAVRPLESPNAFVRSSAGHSVRKCLIKDVTYGQPILAGPRIRSLALGMAAPTPTIA